MLKRKHWIVTKDCLDKIEYENTHPNLTIPFRLYDDDNVLYYEGLMSKRLYFSEEIFEPLDFYMKSTGCTRLEVNNPKNGKWELI